MRVYAIDPGTAKAGLAVFEDGKLVSAHHLSRPSALDYVKLAAGLPGEWVCEKMQERTRMAGAKRNLDAIERLVKKIRQLAKPCKFCRYTQIVWKGGIKKPPHHRRIRKVLSKKERRIFDSCDSEDARDAIGIGLFHLKRVGRGGVPL